MKKTDPQHEEYIDQFLAHQPIKPGHDFTDRVMANLKALEQDMTKEEEATVFYAGKRIAPWAVGIAATLVLGFGLNTFNNYDPSNKTQYSLNKEDHALFYGDTYPQPQKNTLHDTTSASTDYAMMEDLLLIADQLAILEPHNTNPEWAISDLLDTHTL